MPMAAFRDVDFNSRITALRATATALALAPTATPAQSASGSHMACVAYINKMNAAVGGLPQYTNLDHNGFMKALNALTAKVP